ncbi:MAG TPA: porin family protein [Burkholderiaceae bacterium]|nr:porin family protein [Burkholderiaceae bacterium]
MRIGSFARTLRALACAACLVPAAAVAQWYVGVGFGPTNNEFLPSFNPANSNIDDSDTAYKILVGHSFGPNFSAELEFADLNTLVRATAPGQSTQIDASTFALSLVGRFPVYTDLAMFGRIGLGRWDSDLLVTGASGSGSGFDPLIGLGLEYSLRFAPANLKLALEWTQYQNVGEGVAAGNTKLTGQNVDVIWLRLTYHFRLAPGP